MKRFVLCICVGCVLLGARALDPDVAAFRAPVQVPREIVKGYVWAEAEGFADYGNWRLDTQFVHKMGSGYLLAAGVLKPVGRATTRIEIPSSGTWFVWCRTKDWLPEYHPGTFRVMVDGRPGRTLGRSGNEGWRWERAGEWKLQGGSVELCLEDISGAFARCDALLLTTDGDYAPPDDAVGCAKARVRFSGLDTEVADGGDYDFVVVGAGPGGMSAALAAARRGVNVALVHDRPFLGGNASSELGVPTMGAAISHPNAREGGLCEEANLIRLGLNESAFSSAFRLMAGKLPNLRIFSNSRVEQVEKCGSMLSAVVARDTLTGRSTRYRGKLFLDGTGDGWVGYFAGAQLLHGREAKSDYGEYPAPPERDKLLMSGCLMGNYLGYRYRKTENPVPFATPVWARVLPQGFKRWTTSGSCQWWVEHGGRFDELADPERARDELVRITLAYWGWLKNGWQHKDRLLNHELYELAHMNGRREGFRILGDYVMTGNDCLEGRMFEDRISYGGWPLDRHDPLGIDNPTGNGYCEIHPDVPIYSIPYRILYSKNVQNLMMAGRNVSVTHVALGSVRVESTIMTMGQAAGTAAALMLKRGLLPREFGSDRSNVHDLQQELLKDDQYIPGIFNEDPLDLARGASVEATSLSAERIAHMERSPLFGLCEDRDELVCARAACFPSRGLRRIAAFECMLESTSDKPVPVCADIFSATDGSGSADSMRHVGTAVAKVPGGWRGPIRFVPSEDICVADPYIWIRIAQAREVFWRMMDHGDDSHGVARAFGKDGFETVVEGRAYSFTPENGDRKTVDTKPEYVVDGVSRPVGFCTHGWFSDPAAALPQSIALTLKRPARVREVRLTFDTDLGTLLPKAHPKTLVRSYRVEGLTEEGEWVTMAANGENRLRHCVHDVVPRVVKAVRVTVLQTWGDHSARIFEIRLY